MPSDTCNRIRVERFFLEEAPAEEKHEIGRHLEGCRRCQEHLDFLSREQKAYLAVRPFTSFAAKHLETKAPSLIPSFGPRWLPALSGALAMVALVVALRTPGMFGLQGGSAQSEEQTEEIQERVVYKGGEVFEFQYRRDGKLREGGLGDEYQAGDQLQFIYAAGQRTHVALASVDAAGKVSLYRRDGAASASFPAKAGKLEPFPFSVTLDAARGGELFVALFSQGPTEDAALEGWLSEAYRLAAGDLAALEKALHPPASASSGLAKTLLLKKASP